MEKSESPDKIQELERITEILLDRAQKDSAEALDSLNSLFDLLLWAEKRCETTLLKAIECQLMVIVLEKYRDSVHLLVSGFILLLGNAKEEGLLVKHLL
jgi:hypothetical protein